MNGTFKKIVSRHATRQVLVTPEFAFPSTKYLPLQNISSATGVSLFVLCNVLLAKIPLPPSLPMYQGFRDGSIQAFRDGSISNFRANVSTGALRFCSVLIAGFLTGCEVYRSRWPSEIPEDRTVRSDQPVARLCARLHLSANRLHPGHQRTPCSRPCPGTPPCIPHHQGDLLSFLCDPVIQAGFKGMGE